MPFIYTEKNGEQVEVVGLVEVLKKVLLNLKPEEKPMQKYKCHKVVEAMKIGVIEEIGEGWLLTAADLEDDVTVTLEYMEKHLPQLEGYYVRYEDGYESYSPVEAFEDGYTLIPETEAA